MTRSSRAPAPGKSQVHRLRHSAIEAKQGERHPSEGEAHDTVSKRLLGQRTRATDAAVRRYERVEVHMRLLADTVPAIAGGQPVRQGFLTFGAPFIGEEEIHEVVDTLRSGWIGFGPKCLQLEARFARYTSAPYAISLSSCTAALHLALVAAGVGPGDEVITTPLTFPATANVIEHVNARPVFVDVDRSTQNLDPTQVAEAISPRTKAIIPVHMGGRPCDMSAISDIARRNELTVIEDAAHAVEAAWDGQKVGSVSRFTAFSFYATKNLTTADGGMLTTTDPAAANQIRMLRMHGISRDAWQRFTTAGGTGYDTLAPGYKYNLTDLQASLGLHQLARLEDRLIAREELWRQYDAGLADLGAFLEIPAPIRSQERHARHLYTILLTTDRLRVDRDQFVEAMKAENVGAGVHFRPVHLHSYYRSKYGHQPGEYPHAEEIGRRTVSLPIAAKLTAEDVQDAVTAVRKLTAYYSH